MPTERRVTRRWVSPALAMAVLVVSGCSSGIGGVGKKDPAELTITPATGTQQVSPDAGVSVRASHGKLLDVAVTDPAGGKAEGTLTGEGRSWRTRWTLRPATTYTVSARATGDDGKEITKQASFTTLKPPRTLDSGMSPLDGEKVGVGMPVQLLLSRDVTAKKDKAAIESALEVKTSKPIEGAWNWVSDREVQYRPREYWPTGEKVKVVAHLAGVRAGDGLWGAKDRSTEFTIGPRHITKVDAGTHTATVTDGDKVVRKIPVSLGKPGDDSYSGIMIAQEKSANMIMDSATTGNPGEYRIPTKWNVRMTYSGTFFHAAPWSTGAQGNSNVSHGCVNASEANARWFFEFTNRGDIIEVTGTSRKLRFGNGPTPWAKSWDDWRAGSAQSSSTP